VFLTVSEAEKEDAPPTRERPLVGDAVFLSVMESGFLAADLLAKLTSQQLYYYTYLLINYDGANKKEYELFFNAVGGFFVAFICSTSSSSSSFPSSFPSS
jgi:hypothetical protein